MAESALISAAELAEIVGDVVVLDVQYTLDGQGADLYASRHLPGAPHLDLDTVLADPAGDRGRHPMPSVERLQHGLRALGLHDDSAVIVYDQGPSLGAARAWCVLRWAGLTDVRVLDGGLAAWVRAGLPVETSSAASPAPSSPVPQPGNSQVVARRADTGADSGAEAGTLTVRPDSVPILDVDDVLEHIAGGGVLLDARTAERFRGEVEPIDTEAGHIPGAMSLPVSEVMDADGTFADAAVIRSVLGQRGIPLDGPVATSCGSGITACQLSLALHEAGIESAPFIGSWSEWIRDPGRPRATGDA